MRKRSRHLLAGLDLAWLAGIRRAVSVKDLRDGAAVRLYVSALFDLAVIHTIVTKSPTIVMQMRY